MAVVLLLCLAGESWADGISQDLAQTSLKHFTQVEAQIYAGSKPGKDADFEFLRSKGVKYILQANFLPWMTGRERAQAAKYGMQFLSVPMNASFISPREKHVNQALRIMRTKQPIYIHCVLGRDRTSLLAGLYKIYFDGVSRDTAYQQMRAEGFRTVFYLRGLKAYFNKHTKIPAELADLAAPSAN